MESSVEAQLHIKFPSFKRTERSNLCNLIIKNTKKADIFSVKEETVSDLTNIPTLNNFLFANEPTKAPLNINRLSGIESGKIKTMKRKVIKDGIDLVLRIFEINYEIATAATLKNCDLGISSGTDILLKEKLRRCGATPTQLEKFISILSLEQIPDIRPAVESGEFTLPEIIKIRDKFKAKQFRRWLHATETKDARELEQVYVKVLGNKFSSKLPVRMLRLFVTATVGLIDPTAGITSSVVDSVFVEKWLRGYSPKLFLEKLRALPLDSPKSDE